jgi:hypothetical protein
MSKRAKLKIILISLDDPSYSFFVRDTDNYYGSIYTAYYNFMLKGKSQILLLQQEELDLLFQWLGTNLYDDYIQKNKIQELPVLWQYTNRNSTGFL